MNEKKTNIEINSHIQDNYPKQSQDQQQLSASELQLLSNYQSLMQDYSYARIDLSHIPRQKFEEHKIALLDNIYQPFGKNQILQNNHDFVFSVLQTQFYGLQYLYEIIISKFKLKINILNLQRQSDTGEEDIDSKQLGTGSFGEVRVLIVNDKKYAVKRIPFQYKLQPEEGYDYQVSKDEQLKLRGALKEYCYFKIFSLLGIGPKIVKSNYDLICFNNCIQFKMQLCQPLLNKIADKQQHFDFQQYKRQLYQKLFMLHSINFVHRDIKPDNILYNPNQNCFVLGDFGLVSFLKENLRQKTKTRFAGTPNYCGDQMTKLLDGGTGFVNLYLNDLICLQKTFEYTQEYLFSHNSRISQNSLSFNASGSIYQSEHNDFSQNNEQLASQANLTDQSYIPTRNSVLTLPTAHTLAPPKFASSINHYQAEIIYTVCRTQQRRIYLSKEYLLNLIYQKEQQHKNTQISVNLMAQLYLTFHFQNADSTIINFIKEWKNSSRHFGPQSIRTLSQIDKLVQISNQKQRSILVQIKGRLKNYHSSIKQNQLQVIMMKNIRNLQMFLQCYLTYLINLIRQSRNRPIKEDQALFTAQNFIFAMKYLRQFNEQAKEIHKMVIIIYRKSKNQIAENCSLIETLQFTLKYLRSKNKIKPADLLYFLQILQQLTSWQGIYDWDQVNKLIEAQLNLILLTRDQLNQEQKIILIGFLLRMNRGQKLTNLTQLNINQYLETANQIVQNQLQIIKNNGLQQSFLLFFIQKMIILYQSQKYQDALMQCENILRWMDEETKQNKIMWKQYIVVYFNLASIYNHLESFHLSLTYNYKALEILQKQIGCLNYIQLTFNILNNALLSYYKGQMLEKYDLTLQETSGFLLKVSYRQKYRKLTYISQLQMKRLLQIGLDTPQRKKRASQLVQKILDGFYLYITKECGNNSVLDNQSNNHLVNISSAQGQDKIYILTEIVNFIRRKPHYRQLFLQQYISSNLQLAIYVKFTLKRNYDCIKYIWNALKPQLQKFHPSQLQERDYKIAIIYTDCLIKSKSNRFAIRFLYSIIKYIPETFKEIKYKAIKLMYQALKTIGNNKQNLFYQITKKDCSLLRNNCFIILPSKLKDDRRFRILQLKYLKKICLAQMEQFI